MTSVLWVGKAPTKEDLAFFERTRKGPVSLIRANKIHSLDGVMPLMGMIDAVVINNRTSSTALIDSIYDVMKSEGKEDGLYDDWLC